MKKILIVDDEEGVRFSIGNILAYEGYSLDFAESYEEAVALLEQTRYELVLTDIILGGKSGIDVLRTIKELDPPCPVILLTGAPSIETASEAVRLGAYDYLQKPVTKSALIRIVEKVLEYIELKSRIDKYQANLDAIFSSITEGIITFDKDLNILELNRAARKICAISGAAVGKTHEHLLNDCDGNCMEAVKRTIETREPSEMFRVVCKPKDAHQQNARHQTTNQSFHFVISNNFSIS